MIAAPFALALLGWSAFYLQPQWLMSAAQSRFDPQSVLFFVDSPAPRVALTIDDCPTDSTEALLDQLKAHNARATFFIISSYVKGREKTVERMVREGHELANHMVKVRGGVGGYSWRLQHEPENAVVESSYGSQWGVARCTCALCFSCTACVSSWIEEASGMSGNHGMATHRMRRAGASRCIASARTF
jgi:hypothetical protein